MSVPAIESLSNLFGLFWLLLPVAAASGWWMARRSDNRTTVAPRSARSDYFRGLNYLLDDKPDQALEVFARMAELDQETVETQIMLGVLFRHRGEVERAIHIHHHLTVRGDLSIAQRQRATLELAEDYLRAGLFDRAETLFRALIEQDPASEGAAQALNRLLKLYEQGKDWLQAIQYCDLLERMTGQVRQVEAAHYCCELALLALDRDAPEEAGRWLREALRRHSRCVRASLLLARLALQRDQRQAIKVLSNVESQNPLYLSEVLIPLENCYNTLNQTEAYTRWLQDMQQRYRYGWLTARLARHLAQSGESSRALTFLAEALEQQPTIIGLRTLIEINVQREDGERGDLQTLYRASGRMLDGAAHYRCDQCGFTVKSLNWQCPSCKQWESIKPLPDLVCRSHPA